MPLSSGMGSWRPPRSPRWAVCHAVCLARRHLALLATPAALGSDAQAAARQGDGPAVATPLLPPGLAELVVLVWVNSHTGDLLNGWADMWATRLLESEEASELERRLKTGSRVDAADLVSVALRWGSDRKSGGASRSRNRRR